MKRLIKTNITLLTQNDKSIVPALISYDDDEDTVNPVKIQLIYDNIAYHGIGKDYLWVDALADLQSRLPHNMKIACCLTCRHGNMCPFGNAENQLFCTKDLLISSKEDMIDLFDKTDPFAERKVAAINCCDDHVYQSDDYYTYNDYLYHLKKK